MIGGGEALKKLPERLIPDPTLKNVGGGETLKNAIFCSLEGGLVDFSPQTQHWWMIGKGEALKKLPERLLPDPTLTNIGGGETLKNATFRGLEGGPTGDSPRTQH
jgi:hypothetical protein